MCPKISRLFVARHYKQEVDNANQLFNLLDISLIYYASVTTMTRDMLRIIAEVLLNAHPVNMQLYLLAFPPLELLPPYVCTNCEVPPGSQRHFWSLSRSLTST